MAQRVFVAVTARQYEGSDTVGVCSTRERAAAAFRHCIEGGRLQCSHDEHWVEVWTVNGACEPVEVFADEILDALASIPAPRPASPSSDTEAAR
jgi:hypothetical protein